MSLTPPRLRRGGVPATASAASTRNSVEPAVVNGLMLRCLGPHSLRAAAILAGFTFPFACDGARPQAKDATETNAILRESDGGLGGEGGRQPRGVVDTASDGIEPDASSEASERAFDGDAATLSRDPASVRVFLCRERKPCRLDRFVNLVSAPGAIRALVLVRLGGDRPVDDDPQSVSFEEWLVTAAPGGRLTKRLLILTLGVNPDGSPVALFAVHGNRLHYELNANTVFPSNWTGISSADLDLDPPRLVSSSWWGFHRFAGCQQEHSTWNRLRFWRSVTWSRQLCVNESRQGPIRVEHDQMDKPEWCREFAYDEVPVVSLDDSFARDGWKQTALGRCALDVDGSEGHGFVTFGQAQNRNDASFRAVLAGEVLFVEVHDDVLTGPSAK